ncbi:helix-turn-helix transcriptional regulator [bacterium]|nr:helix-turn-helix transcriptional regulator [bacterium]
MKELTKLEEVVMIAIWRLGDMAYGVEIKKQVYEILGKEYFYNTLYTTFDQLIRKGFINKNFGEPSSVRGGKRKVFFRMTEMGELALEEAFERQSRVWGSITLDGLQRGEL